MSGTHLFSPLSLRDVTFRNRIAVSPMCQYSCEDGFATDWHLVHLGSRAVGGSGLVLAEATAVEACGRISPGDLGIWKDEHIPALARIARFLKEQGAIPGIQIAHAGRKASTRVPWDGGTALTESEGGWHTVAPSALPFHEGDPVPAELTVAELRKIVEAFTSAAIRSRQAGFEVVEIHSAHGYLLHEFLSPLTNRRRDRYGGSFENRIRMLLETVEAVRSVWPSGLPVFVRISATDWVDGGWDLDQSVALGSRLGSLGVDLIDCSSGGIVPHAKIPVAPGYQAPLAERIRRDAGIPTGSVGLITNPQQADEIIRKGQADLALLAREMLRDPYWPLHAALALRATAGAPLQYLRAFPHEN